MLTSSFAIVLLIETNKDLANEGVMQQQGNNYNINNSIHFFTTAVVCKSDTSCLWLCLFKKQTHKQYNRGKAVQPNACSETCARNVN